MKQPTSTAGAVRLAATVFGAELLKVSTFLVGWFSQGPPKMDPGSRISPALLPLTGLALIFQL